ncbi:Hypothetical predicted protein [Marmota monax]|uniref:Uncharacterized protein n=1 Tax=Marmota monax TaxID=9995 RepID=A0A5E4C0R7_MARMO|nr:Hypothetical predicted protein [Marmota monax]
MACSGPATAGLSRREQATSFPLLHGGSCCLLSPALWTGVLLGLCSQGTQRPGMLCPGVNSLILTHFGSQSVSLFLQAPVPPFCGPLLRRQQKAEEEARASRRYETGKQYFAKELKETKDRLHAKWPPFIFTLQNVIPKESQKASGVPRKSKAFSPERPICMEKKRLFGKEKTTDLSQLAFERQFRFSQLCKSKEAEKKGLVSETWGRAWLAGFGSIPKTVSSTSKAEPPARPSLKTRLLGAEEAVAQERGKEEAAEGDSDSMHKNQWGCLDLELLLGRGGTLGGKALGHEAQTVADVGPWTPLSRDPWQKGAVL